VFLHPDSASSRAAPAIGTDALQRRTRLDLHLTNDRPIPAALVQRIAATGAHVRVRSRWLRAVSVEADVATVARLRKLGFVTGVRPVAIMQSAGHGSDDRSARRSRTRLRQAFDSAFYSRNWQFMSDLGIPPAHALGFRGENVRIALLDTGFETRHEAFEGRRVVATRDFINGDDIVYNQVGDIGSGEQARQGTQVWSLVGGFRPG
jgi:hypothetical protein